VVHYVGIGVKKAPRLPTLVKVWGATVVGLGAIPFIIHPIDHAVDFLLDNTLRQLYRCSRGLC
jgi:hypothetical protein